jgi:hypothetical protein
MRGGLQVPFFAKKKKGIGPGVTSGATSGRYGHVDAVDREGVKGWFVDAAQPLARQTVTAHLGGEPVGVATCQKKRPDISEILGKPTACGFAMAWDWTRLREALDRLPAAGPCPLEVRAPDGTPLAGPPPALDMGEVREWVAAAASAQSCGLQASACEVVACLEGMRESPPHPRERDDRVRIIAYYLPQFHPIPENDEWWGPGFTEWTNVSQAVPYFEGHYQPHVPGELGYYDLRLPEVREAQANLAREYGISGFCYYYYWFAGRRLLERPLEQVLALGKPDFPFCICWANENWSRRWDGSEQEVLVQQVHDPATDEAFIRDVIPVFKDPRYIRLGGAPLLIVYRLSLLPSPVETAARWRRICAEEGIPRIHLCMAETFGLSQPHLYGFDSAVQFPPHGNQAPGRNHELHWNGEGFTGAVFSMRDVVADQMARELPAYKRFPGVMTSWDNTPRKKKAGHVFIDATPEVYEMWLRHAVDVARRTLPEGERLVFVNAWNEWAEGAHLEPDRKNGRTYLEATRRVVAGQSGWRLALDHARALDCLSGEGKDAFLREMRQHLERLSLVNTQLMRLMGETGLPKQWVTAKPGLPFWMRDMPVIPGGRCCLDQINNIMAPTSPRVAVDGCVKLYLYGWAFYPSVKLAEDTPGYVVFQDAANEDTTYYAPLAHRIPREDVAQEHSRVPKSDTFYSGFKVAIDISALPPGLYRPCFVHRTETGTGLTRSEVCLEVS